MCSACVAPYKAALPFHSTLLGSAHLPPGLGVHRRGDWKTPHRRVPRSALHVPRSAFHVPPHPGLLCGGIFRSCYMREQPTVVSCSPRRMLTTPPSFCETLEQSLESPPVSRSPPREGLPLSSPPPRNARSSSHKPRQQQPSASKLERRPSSSRYRQECSWTKKRSAVRPQAAAAAATTTPAVDRCVRAGACGAYDRCIPRLLIG